MNQDTIKKIKAFVQSPVVYLHRKSDEISEFISGKFKQAVWINLMVVAAGISAMMVSIVLPDKIENNQGIQTSSVMKVRNRGGKGRSNSQQQVIGIGNPIKMKLIRNHKRERGSNLLRDQAFLANVKD